MIHFYVRNYSLIKMMHHTFLCVQYTWSHDQFCNQISVCGTAMLPDFRKVENDQILSKTAPLIKFVSNVNMVTLQPSKKSWLSTALQKDIKLEVCMYGILYSKVRVVRLGINTIQKHHLQNLFP